LPVEAHDALLASAVFWFLNVSQGAVMKDLNLLYTFEALWRDHSASIAAQNLGVTQAAVSGAPKRLRND